MSVRNASAFDLPTAEALARLHLMVDEAVRRASDPSETARHLAVVLLDGAVEHALWLACNRLGAQLKDNASFEQLKSTLTTSLAAQNLPAWNPVASGAVLQLRRTRNNAQHAALTPAVEHMPSFALAAPAFIDSVLTAAYDVRLADLMLALAVDPGELRERLLGAERQLERDAPSAFDESAAAFDVARGRWHQRHSGRVLAETMPQAK